MFEELNSKKELNDETRAELEREAGIKPPDGMTHVMFTGIGVPNKVSQAGRIGRDDNKNGWTRNGGYNTIDRLQVFPQGRPYMKLGLAAFNPRFYGNNGVGGFVSGPSMDRVAGGLYLNKDVKEIILPPSVKYIGSHAFDGFEKLEKIIIPGDVTEIGEFAFCNCNNLTNIDIKGNVDEFSGGIIYNLENLTSLKIDGNVGKFDGNAIYACDNLNSIEIGGNVGEFSEFAVFFHRNLTSLKICGNVGKIDGHAILNCDNLTSIEIVGNIGKTDFGAILECENLTSFKIGGSVETMDNHAILDCPKLNSVSIGGQVRERANNGFADCPSSQEVTISARLLTTLKDDELKQLELIKLTDMDNEFDCSIFKKCTNLQRVVILNKKITLLTADKIRENCPNHIDLSIIR